VDQNHALNLNVDHNHAMNLNPIYDLDEIKRNWPLLSQNEINTAMNNHFVSRKSKEKRRGHIGNSRGSTGKRKKQFLIPPPQHRSSMN
jgi:phenylacetate-coenzyme A ligase PaaK-like adenylate-forming protein